MSFILSEAHVRSLLAPAENGNLDPFVSAMEPDLHWMIGTEDQDPKSLTGVYNLQTWKDIILAQLVTKLSSGLKLLVDHVDVVGMKALVEARGEATQKNGRPYNQRFFWVVIFDEKSGKIVTIREYANTALIREVLESN